MKKILILAFAVLCTGVAFGQVKKVAILEPVARGGGQVSQIQKEIVLAALEKAITSIDGYNAFTRTDIDAINFEQSFQQNGMVDDAQRKKLGVMSGVDFICISVLTPDKENGDFFVKCSLIQMESGKLDNSDNELMKMSPNSEINEGCKRLAERLLGGKSGSNSSGSSGSASIKLQQRDTDSWKCGNNIYAVLDGKTLTISGTGKMDNYESEKNTPWYANIKDIEKITIQQGITSIGGHAFYGCANLTSVAIANGVVSIGFYSFGECKSLKNITLPVSITHIESCAFAYSGLSYIKIPANVSYMTNPFADCVNLKTINVDANNQYYISIDGVVYNKNRTSLIMYPTGKEGSYNIENGTKNIERLAFAGCDKLMNITIPEGVTRIGNQAFSNCKALKSITIPTSVTNIGSGAFRYNNLTSLISLNPTPPNIELENGDVHTSNVILYVPDLTAYKNAKEWNKFKNIQIVKQVVQPLAEIQRLISLNMNTSPTYSYDKGKYKGQKNSEGKYSGLGAYSWNDGTFYFGRWVNNSKSGYGIYIAPDGYYVTNCPGCKYYIGEWSNNEKSGTGTCYDKDGKLIYDGKFASNKPTKTYPVTGEWSSFKFEIKCIDKDRHIGETKDGKRHGRGIYFWSDGGMWYGYWKDEQRDGYGIYINLNGAITTGTWKGNTRQE